MGSQFKLSSDSLEKLGNEPLVDKASGLSTTPQGSSVKFKFEPGDVIEKKFTNKAQRTPDEDQSQ